MLILFLYAFCKYGKKKCNGATVSPSGEKPKCSGRVRGIRFDNKNIKKVDIFLLLIDLIHLISY